MSTAPTAFLREQAAKKKDQLAKHRAVLDEWHAALNRLYGSVREWVRDANPDGYLTVTVGKCQITEPVLGTYSAPRIDIHGFDQLAGFVPKARYTVGTAIPPQAPAPARAAGRVDFSDEVRRYVLYRLHSDTGEQRDYRNWVAHGRRGQPKNNVTPTMRSSVSGISSRR